MIERLRREVAMINARINAGTETLDDYKRLEAAMLILKRDRILNNIIN